MEPRTVVIGNKSRFSSRTQKSAAGNPNGKDKPKATGKVLVYSDGRLIEEVPFGLLVRFSKLAQDRFPKPIDAAKNKQTHIKDQAKPSEAAAQKTSNTEIGKPSEAPAVAHEAPSPSKATASNAKSPQPQLPRKVLDVKNENLWLYPTVQAFQFAFNWMREAQRTSGDGKELLYYGVPEPEKLQLTHLIDLYAAALCLDLRPRPKKLRKDILDRLTEQPPLIEDVMFIHEHLPITDSIVTRMLTSFLQNRAAKKGWYTKEEREGIEDYIFETDVELFDRYQDIASSRSARSQSENRGQAMAKLQKVAEGGVLVDKAGQVGSPRSKETVSTGERAAAAVAPEASRIDVEKKGNTVGSRRRRGRGRKGLDRNGNPVPGANY